MRIFEIITLSDLGGAQSVVINLSNTLAEKHDVHVISSTGGRMWLNLSGRVKQHKVPNLQRKISLFKELLVMISLRKLYKKFKPDIIHLHSSKIGIIGRLIFPKKKIVYTVHGFSSIQLAYRKFLPLEKLLSEKAAFIVGVSKYDVLAMKNEGIIKNVVCIYNGTNRVDLSLCQNGINLFKKIKRLKGEGFKIVLTIARLSPPKDFGLFNNIAKSMESETIRFVWVGNDTIPPIKVSDNVILGGEVTNASVLNSIADLFILPSNFEGLPMSIIEAQSYGVPVIASDVGGVSEMLNGDNGIAVKNDPDLFKKEIINFLNPDKYISARQSSLNFYNENFTVEKMSNSYLNVFNQILWKEGDLKSIQI